MFTGLIQSKATVRDILKTDSGLEFTFDCPQVIQDIKVDDSIAINGVCLTATKVLSEGFVATAVHLTLEKTNLSKLMLGELVNLELSLRFSDRLGGHMVQGHVNGVAPLVAINPKGDNYEIKLKLSPDLSRYVVSEGSITLEGISLTVAKKSGDEILITIIPHTWLHTNLSQKKVGDLLNVEVDMMAKYIENYLTHFMQGEKRV